MTTDPTSPAILPIRCAAQTDVGLERKVNEDAHYVDSALGLYVVCDGMGGHASGQVASELAIETIVSTIKTGEPQPQPGEEALVVAMQAANQAIYDRSQKDDDCHGMGTTAVGIRIDDKNRFHVCHCGDSRTYQLRDGELKQLTRDHSLLNLYEDHPELDGQLGPPTSNVIIRAVGLEKNVVIDHQIVEIKSGDAYLLCCDGLTDLVEDWMIREIMTSGDPLPEIAANLIRAANANGGSDNVTVIVLHVGEQSPEGRPETLMGH